MNIDYRMIESNRCRVTIPAGHPLSEGGRETVYVTWVFPGGSVLRLENHPTQFRPAVQGPDGDFMECDPSTLLRDTRSAFRRAHRDLLAGRGTGQLEIVDDWETGKPMTPAELAETLEVWG